MNRNFSITNCLTALYKASRTVAYFALLATAVFMLTPAQAQISGTGTIEGTVMDPSGAIIPGAKVTAQNVATGDLTVRVTTSGGLYNLSPLNPGMYSVTVVAPGFEKMERQNIRVDGLQVISIDMNLKMGSQETTVTVTTAPPPLDTADAQLGAVMGNEEYKALPLEMGGSNGISTDQRRASDFAALLPGVTNNETKNNESDEPMVVDGNASATQMYIEGVPFDSASVSGDPRYIWSAFSVEAIDQFQLKTSGYGAEYQGLGVENFTIKSGTNHIHGSVYDIFRNTALDAAGFIPASYPANYPNAALAGKTYKAPEHMNEFGITLGGPIWRDKIFLFGNYMGFRFSTLTKPQFQTVPTAAQLCGDFSTVSNPGLTAANSNIYDPTTQSTASGSYTRTQFTGNPTWTPTGGCGSGPVANNVIPQNEISPIAQYLQQWTPPPTNSSLINNYLGSYAWGLNNWSTTDRLDFDLSSRHKISAIFGWGRQGLVGLAGSQTTDVLPSPYLYAKTYAPITKVVILKDTYVINSNLVNDFNYGAGQYHSPDKNPTYGVAAFAASAAGISGLPSGQASGSFPYEKWTGGPNPPPSWGPQTGYVQNTNTFSVSDNLQWVHGKHDFTFGGQYEWLQFNDLYADAGTTLTTLNLGVSETAGVSGTVAKGESVTANTGLPYASFLLGAIDSGTYTEYAPIAQETGARYHPFAIYVNDDWKVTNKLTINAGLRWDSMPPMHEAQDRFSFLNPTATNPVTGSPGTLEFAGHGTDSCNCTTPMHTYYKDFGPRLGFAYSATSKTVLRGSYGIFYAHGGGTSGGATSLPSSAMELGFAASPNPVSPGNALPAFYLNNSAYFTTNGIANTTFGGSTVATPPVYDPAYATYYSSAASGVDKVSSTLAYLDPYYAGRTPTFEGWSFGFQQLLTRNMTATVSYVGNQGHFLTATGSPRGYYSNQLDPKYLSLGATLGNTATTANMPGGALPYATFNNKVSQALLAFPQYSGVTDQVASVANSNYNALQISIVQRESHGLTFMLNYTHSKTIDDAGTFRTGYAIPAGVVANSGAPWQMDRIDRSLSLQDVPNNVVFTTTYKLPFGRGHMGGGNAITSALTSGWGVSGIFTRISGNPLAITSSACTGVTGQGTCMPAYNTAFTGSVRQNGKWGQGATAANLGKIQYINPAAFLQTSSFAGVGTNGEYVLGDVSRTAPYGLRGPGNSNIDASISRTFDIYKSVKFVFEASAFNVANHVWFGSAASTADGTIGSSVSLATATPSSVESLGTVSGQSNSPRQFQLAGHINF